MTGVERIKVKELSNACVLPLHLKEMIYVSQ